MTRRLSAVFIGLFAMVSVAGAAGIQIVDATIDPAPDQQIIVAATGVDTVIGLNLYLEVTQSDLAITGIEFLDGTIWENNNEGQDSWIYPEANLPTAGWAFGVVIAHIGAVSTPGTLAKVTVDATGLDGQTAIITANTSEVASDFAGTPADAFVDGTITIRDNTPANHAPLANAGPDQAVTEGDLVTLAGDVSDPDGDSLTYEWTQLSGPAVNLQDATTLVASFIAPAVDAASEVVLRLNVSDGTETASDQVAVTVNPVADDPPADDDSPPDDEEDDDDATPDDDGDATPGEDDDSSSGDDVTSPDDSSEDDEDMDDPDTDESSDDDDAQEPSDDDTQSPGDSEDTDSTDQSGDSQDTDVTDEPADTTDDSTSEDSNSQEDDDEASTEQQNTTPPVSACGTGLVEACSLTGIGLAFASARRRRRLITWR